jgi:hypothetical protein
MAELRRFVRRTSGTVLKDVRRPNRTRQLAKSFPEQNEGKPRTQKPAEPRPAKADEQAAVKPSKPPEPKRNG